MPRHAFHAAHSGSVSGMSWRTLSLSSFIFALCFSSCCFATTFFHCSSSSSSFFFRSKVFWRRKRRVRPSMASAGASANDGRSHNTATAAADTEPPKKKLSSIEMREKGNCCEARANIKNAQMTDVHIRFSKKRRPKNALQLRETTRKKETQLRERRNPQTQRRGEQRRLGTQVGATDVKPLAPRTHEPKHSRGYPQHVRHQRKGKGMPSPLPRRPQNQSATAKIPSTRRKIPAT